MTSPTPRSSISLEPRVPSSTELTGPDPGRWGSPAVPEIRPVEQVCPSQACTPTIAVRLWGLFTP